MCSYGKMSTIPASFVSRKEVILQNLHKGNNASSDNVNPESKYSDLSPKGSVDEEVLPLIAAINAIPGLVTTSSCAGRCVVWADGDVSRPQKADVGLSKGNSNNDAQKNQAPVEPNKATKAQGGRWLFTSHAPLPELSHSSQAPKTSPTGTHPGSYKDMFGLRGIATSTSSFYALQSMRLPASDSSPTPRLVHLRFEPLIAHILTASPAHAQLALGVALSCGFRESGAVSLEGRRGGDACPLVAVRSHALALDVVIGAARHEVGGNDVCRSIVTEDYLAFYAQNVINSNFEANARRRRRLIDAFEALQGYDWNRSVTSVSSNWEDADTRRKRKRAEGLAMQESMRARKARDSEDASSDATINAGEGDISGIVGVENI